MGLDHIIKVSVGDIISELFYKRRRIYSYGYQSGETLHYRLGFMNSEKFCRFIQYDNFVVKLCGVPDRISVENGIAYVDELKTTITGRENFIRKVGIVQLQLYMYITGIERGRLWIYYKDRDELVKDLEVYLDRNFVERLVKAYVESKLYLQAIRDGVGKIARSE